MILSIILIIFSLIQLCRPYKKKNIIFYIMYVSIIIVNFIFLAIDLMEIKYRGVDMLLIITTTIIAGIYLYTKLTTYKK